jgi:HAD superfamily hydrolase (TIGR01509 family)
MAAILFDLDGVLIDSESLKARAHAATVADFGGEVDPLYYGTVMGRDHATVRAAFLRKGSITATANDDYSARYRSHYETLVDAELVATPGALALLESLASSGEYKLALVTSSQRWMVDRVFKRVPLAAHFDLTVTADDVERHKPYPDAYLLAAERLDTPAHRAVIFEDSEAGVTAAVDSGASVVAVRHPFNPTHDFTGVAKIIQSLAPPSATIALIKQLLDDSGKIAVL